MAATDAITPFLATRLGSRASAQADKPAVARNVVLMHGAWADGSGRSEVIARLQAAGLHVTNGPSSDVCMANSTNRTKPSAKRWL
jgi:ribosomal protein S11